jgi:hypothetical protein
MRAVVLVPYRGGERWRELSWAYVQGEWAKLGLPIVTGDRPGPFNRSAARNAAARKAGDWDVGIFVDADTIVRDTGPVREAIELAHRTGRVVLPHDRYRAMTASGTGSLFFGRPNWNALPSRHPVQGGVVVVPRRAWDRIGGYEERLNGWGGEDVVFMYCARELVGLDRLPGEIWHLWHPVDRTRRRYVVEKGGPLMHRYRAVKTDPAGLAALIAER